MDDYQRISQFRPWQRITAVFTLLFFLFQTTSVAVASALSAADIQQSLNDSYEFQRIESNSAYQYVAASNIIDDASLGLSDSEINLLSGPKTVEAFFETVKELSPQTLGEPTYIPISVGDITTFIPVQLLPAKVVGSPFVQTRYIRNQVRELLGRHLIDSSKSDLYGSEAKQLQTLYQGAIEYINLTSTPFGQPLSISREGAVSTDMVWPEVRVINDETVLVPVVYLSSTSMERKVEGHEVEFNGNVSFSSISLDSVEIKARGEFLEVSDFLTATNSSIESPNNLSIIAGGPIQLLSSKIDANGDLVIGGHGISASTLFHRYDIGTEHGTRFGEITSISATGDVIVRSYRDIVMQGVNVIAGENIKFGADGNIYIGALEDVHGTQLSGRWKGSTTSVEYLQSHLTAGESIELMAAGQIQLDAVEMIADEGHIEILAGLGITIQDELGQFSKNAKAKFGKKKVTESVYQTVAIRSALDAGKGVKLHSDYGDITLRSVDITSTEGTQVKAENGAVNLLMTAETDHYAYSSVKKGLFTTKTKSKGHTIETGIPNTIVGGFAVEALSGVNIEYEGLRGFDCSDYLAEIGEVVPFNEDACLRANVLKISEMPGMEWMGEMLALADADPTTYNWNEIVLQHKTWSESNTSLSPAFMAVVTIAVAIATQGVGAGLVGVAAPAAGASFAQVATYAALNAGFTTLVSQATIALGNGAVNGDVAGAMEDFASDETVKSLATSMITAGAIAGLDAAFFDVDSIAVNELLEAGPATPEMIEAAKNAATQSLTMQIVEVVTNATIKSGVNWAVYGGDSDDLKTAFLQSLVQSSVNMLGEHMANKIGEAFNNKNPDDLDIALKYISHAGTGCILGVARSSTSDELDPDSACASGAGGAVLGEFIGSTLRSSEEIKALEQKIDDFVKQNGVLVSRLRLAGYSNEQIRDIFASKGMLPYYINQIRILKEEGVDIARLGAAMGAFFAGAEAAGVNIAADFGENAAENNAMSSLSGFGTLMESINAIDSGPAVSWKDLLSSDSTNSLSVTLRANAMLIVAGFMLTGRADSATGALGQASSSYFSLLQDSTASEDDLAVAQATYSRHFASYMSSFGREDITISGVDLNSDQLFEIHNDEGLRILINPGTENTLPLVTIFPDGSDEAVEWMTISPIMDDVGNPSIYITPDMSDDLIDHILVFPPDTGLPPLHIVYSVWGKSVRGNIDIPSQSGYAKHHLIGIENAAKFPAIRRAVDIGLYDINRSENGISLPSNMIDGKRDVEWGLQESFNTGLPYHGGRHGSAYDRYVEFQLNEIQADYDAGLLGDAELLDKLSQVESKIRYDLINDNIRLQKNDPRPKM